ncbi:MAG TPA: hypothetical protein VLB02_00065 [Candidatus Paceibacterota bacterium]|nr:hypothetical protein [Candidatus Paceibacterota bacterium]
MSHKEFIIIMVLTALITSGVFLASTLITPTVSIPSLFNYSFSSTGTLYESGSLLGSTSPYWWVNSGAKLSIDAGTGKTVQGSLPTNDKWRTIYASANPVDTDNGYHPQNIFRLVSKGTWHNFRQQAYFSINQDELSESPNRNASNGLLLFNRYQDSDNLYYTGIRVDGTAVIKKKQAGKYITLAQKPIIAGTYDRAKNPNLLPKSKWIGLRSEVVTTNGVVQIKLYTDIGKTGVWTLAAQTVDDGKTYGPIIDSKSSAGIRTDFMDVAFDDYKIEEL